MWGVNRKDRQHGQHMVNTDSKVNTDSMVNTYHMVKIKKIKPSLTMVALDTLGSNNSLTLSAIVVGCVCLGVCV